MHDGPRFTKPAHQYGVDLSHCATLGGAAGEVPAEPAEDGEFANDEKWAGEGFTEPYEEPAE